MHAELCLCVVELFEVSTVEEEVVRDLLHHLDAHKSVGPHGLHARVLKELADVLVKSLSMIYLKSWLTGRSHWTGG